jgi:3-hydroxyisobutyrate dehydrogenase
VTETVGFIGLGNMGRPMAERLLRAGYQLYVYDTDPRAMDALAPLGAKPTDSACELATLCSLIFLCLPNSKIVEKIVLGPDGVLNGAAVGNVVIDMTSAYPPSTRYVSEQLQAKGLEMLDAPVSGGPIGAEAGTLAVMVGGKKEVFERSRPILAIIAPKNLSYVVSIGWGHTIKAVNNFLVAIHRWVSIEAVILSVKAGISPQKAVEVLQLGEARNFSLEVAFPNLIFPGKPAVFTTGLMHKDLQIGTDMARELGVPMPMANHIRNLYEFFIWLDGPDKQMDNIINYMEDWADVKIRD